MADELQQQAINILATKTDIFKMYPWIQSIPQWTNELAIIMNSIANSELLSHAVEQFSTKVYSNQEARYNQIPEGKQVNDLKYSYLKDLYDNNFFGKQATNTTKQIKDIEILRKAYSLFNNIGVTIRGEKEIQYKILLGVDDTDDVTYEYTMDETTFINKATRMSVSQKDSIPTLVLAGKTAITDAIKRLESQTSQIQESQNTIVANNASVLYDFGDMTIQSKIISAWTPKTRRLFKRFENYVRSNSKQFWPNAKKERYANRGNLIEAFLTGQANKEENIFHLAHNYLRQTIKNNLPFWQGPDVFINGIGYQVKSDNASVMSWSTVMYLINTLYETFLPFLNINQDTGQIESILNDGFNEIDILNSLTQLSINKLEKEFGKK